MTLDYRNPRHVAPRQRHRRGGTQPDGADDRLGGGLVVGDPAGVRAGSHVRYGEKLQSPPETLPSGYAALLYLYNLR